MIFFQIWFRSFKLMEKKKILILFFYKIKQIIDNSIFLIIIFILKWDAKWKKRI